ncbi:hypothetical protein Pint_16613 [Pistacia integerrima]|uniref:Uncharacterized protein n=1 Tax=Pistacia integerrima TaxID=434235 RepID=A0ACC0ZFN4_9ROSI|nr:hypothetical protein Pint_16613 [Pistacia integerrima]
MCVNGFGIIGAIIHGVSVPVFFIYFRKMINIIGLAYFAPRIASHKIAKVSKITMATQEVEKKSQDIVLEEFHQLAGKLRKDEEGAHLQVLLIIVEDMATCFIQAAWRPYSNRKKMEHLRKEEEEAEFFFFFILFLSMDGQMDGRP